MEHITEHNEVKIFELLHTSLWYLKFKDFKNI